MMVSWDEIGAEEARKNIERSHVCWLPSQRCLLRCFLAAVPERAEYEEAYYR